jgi:hypothetical protein
VLKTFQNFLLYLGIYTSVIIMAGFFLFQYFPEKQPVHIYYLYLFFFVITALSHYLLLSSTSKRQQRFPAYFMGVTAFKLFTSMALIIVYALMYPPEAKKFLVGFFILYVLYTAFEIIHLLKYLRHQKN